MSASTNRIWSSDGLPSEILIRILHLCDYKAIIRLSMTCKRSYEIVRQSTSIQLHIELEAGGLEIVDQSLKPGANYASILEELRGYQDAWLNLKLDPHFQQPFPDPGVGIYQQQFYNKAYFEAFRRPEEDEDGYIQEYPFDRIQVVDFYSSTIPPPLDFKRRFNAFTIDANQDLIILIEYDEECLTSANLHLHHSSTGIPHSLARFPTLTARFEEDTYKEPPPRFKYANSIVMGDILVVYFVPRHRGASRYGDAVIWNWRSGTLLGRILSETYGTAPTFFDKDHLLFYSFPPSSSVESGLARSNQVGLLIYRIPTTATIIHQEPPNADAHVPSYPSLEPTLILEFPKLHSGYRVHEHTLLDTLADQGDVAYRGLAEVAYSHISTVALRLSVAQKEGKKGERRPTTHYSIHVNLDFLPSYLSENQAKEITRVPWAQWGVASTRWFIDNTAVNHGTTYGSLHLRFFCADNTTQLLTLLVFDPHIISRQTPHVLDEIEQQKVLEGQGLAFMSEIIEPHKFVIACS